MAAIESQKQYCGGVFVTSNYVMMLECKFCFEQFGIYKKFLNHIFYKHFDNIDECKNNTNEGDDDMDILNALESDNDDVEEGGFNEQSSEISTSNTMNNAIARELQADDKKQSTSNEKEDTNLETKEKINIRPVIRRRIVKTGVERKFKCKLCGLDFFNTTNLNKHEQRHSSIKPFPCAQCSKAFFTRSELNVHTRWHTGERPCICTYCGKGFVTKNFLNRHEQRDLNNRTFKCDQCDKSYYTGDRLKQHMISHTGERNFVCKVCNNRFITNDALKNHMKIHENALRYECDICHKRFNQRPAMTSHKRREHDVVMGADGKKINRSAVVKETNETPSIDEEEFECIQCGRIYKEEKLLLNHQHTKHGM